MSFKGISWAGNVYEKFEAMCLEVEEAMYQDTVKYMENQVQKVGVSVKKFCSEVMDDLRPLSCVDPTSLASDISPLIPHPHGFDDVNKNPIQSITLKKENEDQVMSNVTADKESPPSGYDANLFSLQSPGIFIENKSSVKCEASKRIGVHRRPIGIKRISRNSPPPKESSRDTSISEGRRSKVACCDTTNYRLASGNADAMASSAFDVRCEPGEAVKGNAPILDNLIESPASEYVGQDTSRLACDDTKETSSTGTVMCELEASVKGNAPFSDNQIEFPASKEVSSAEPIRQVKYTADYISPASDNLLDVSVRLKGAPESTSSCSGLPTESSGSNNTSKVCSLESEMKGVSLSEKGSSVKDDSSSASSPTCNTESCNEDFIMPGDRASMELAEKNEEVPELRVQYFETSGMVKLEESCVLVEGNKLHYGVEGTRKHKSYKKRIREALSLKLKSTKNEKKQEMAGGVNQKVSSAHDSAESESDWELL